MASQVKSRTGLGPIEVGLLDACIELNAIPTRPHVKAQRILTTNALNTGVGHTYAHRVLCDLGHIWVVPLVLFDLNGNFGSPFDPPSNPHVTEAKLSPLGLLVRDCEKGEPPLPVRLINGDSYCGGRQPSLKARGVIDALLKILTDDSVSDEDLMQTISVYEFNEPVPTGDFDALFRGDAVHLSYAPQLRVVEGLVVIDRLPVDVSIYDLHNALDSHSDDDLWREYLRRCAVDEDDPVERLPINEVLYQDLEPSVFCRGTLRVTPGPDVDPHALLLKIIDSYEHFWIWQNFDQVQLERSFEKPVATMLRDWVKEHGEAGTRDALLKMRSLI